MDHLKIIVVLASLVVMISTMQASFADSGTYELATDEKTFDIRYSLDGNVIAIEADKESTSLLIGVENVDDSIFEIAFSSELLAASNAEFVVLVDGLETDYSITYEGDNPQIAFQIPSDTEEIEIIGTSVVPEFPFGALVIMASLSVVVLVSRTRLASFR